MAKTSSRKNNSSATIGFEEKLWLAADKLRNNMDAAEYKHVVLGLIFLKYISDTFEEHHAKLVAGKGEYKGSDPEDQDEYRAENVFWVPPAARWAYLQSSAKQATIGKILDDAMVAIERDNSRLKGVLPKDYARPALDKHRLGEIIDLIGGINLIGREPSPPTPLPEGEGQEERERHGRGGHYRGGFDFAGLAGRAREMRKKKFFAEDVLWQALRNRQLCGAKFRRQHQFGDYICDFYCNDAGLVVECDGESHDTVESIRHDAKRDAYLHSQGLRVLRYRNSRIISDLESILREIAAHLPSPAGRGAGGEGATDDVHPHRSVDILGRVYEYFLTKFASAEGKNGGQFYTPSCVVRLLVGMLAPYKGRVYDPCCGSGGMFVQSEKFVVEHGGRIGDIAIYGQESNSTTRKLALMNLAIRGIEADFGPEQADTFRRDLHPDLRADFVLANPPFNDSDWFRKDDDVRWQFGIPPKGNANFAWVQHFIHHLAPKGMAGFVLANGSMSSNQSGEGEIRKALLEADLVDCMVALPGQLFYSTPIPVCLWFICRDKSSKPSPGLRHPSPNGSGAGGEGCLRNRKGQTLFIDARKMGALTDRVHRELTEDDLEKIIGTYHLWRGDPHPAVGHPLPMGEGKGEGVAKYRDIAGFCKSATLEEIAGHGHVLTPGRYVGAEEVEDDGEPFEEKMPRLVAELNAQFAESAKLEKAIQANLRGLGYGEG